MHRAFPGRFVSELTAVVPGLAHFGEEERCGQGSDKGSRGSRRAAHAECVVDFHRRCDPDAVCVFS